MVLKPYVILSSFRLTFHHGEYKVMLEAIYCSPLAVFIIRKKNIYKVVYYNFLEQMTLQAYRPSPKRHKQKQFAEGGERLKLCKYKKKKAQGNTKTISVPPRA